MSPADNSKPDCSTFDKLFQPLESWLSQHEQDHPPHHREKLSFKLFVRLLVYHFVKNCASGRQLLTDTLTAAADFGFPVVKRATFFDAFQRFPPSWLAQLLAYLLSAVAWQSIPELDALGQLYCVDGSLFPAIATMAWAEYKTRCPAVRLHLCFELNRMLAVQFLVGAGNSNEKQALQTMVTAGSTYIADRGYLSFPLLAAIVAAEAYFVIRAKANLVYTRVQRLTVTLPPTVHHIFQHVTDQRIRVTRAAQQPVYRLVTFHVGAERYLILTNRHDLTTFQVILLYAYRWQVELLFRFLKCTLNGRHLLSQSPEGVTIHFYALLLAALLELRLKQDCVAQAEGTPATPSAPTPAIAGLMIDPTLLAGARGNTFLATVGQKLPRYWKVGQHWLVALRNCLARPFDAHVIHVLGHL